MSIAVPIALFGWPVVVLLLFNYLAPRRAVLVGMLVAWLFLPIHIYPIPGLPDYTKTSAMAATLLLGAVVFDLNRVLAFRFRWVDIPMAVWCLCPIVTSVSNGLGFYDGFSTALNQTVAWGIPYFVGRIYLADAQGLRDLALTVFIGGLIYVPFCLIEIRMSPQFHTWVYGFHQHDWAQTKRFGGWRPTVFMQHGLAVGLWMAVASLTGFWLWFSGALKNYGILSRAYWIPLLYGTTLLCKSAASLLFLAAGTAVLLVIRWSRSRLALAALLLVPVGYVSVRATGIWSGQEIVSLASTVSKERAQSIEYRVKAERLLGDHARRRPLFGWGGWSRNQPGSFGAIRRSVAPDALWIVALGKFGLVGLGAVTAAILLPIVLVGLRLPAAVWATPQGAPAAVLAMMLAMFLLDSLLNAMLNPIHLLAAGGLCGAAVDAVSPPRHRADRAAEGRPLAPREEHP